MYLYYTNGKCSKTNKLMDNSGKDYHLMDDKTASEYNLFITPSLVETFSGSSYSVYVGHIAIEDKIIFY